MVYHLSAFGSCIGASAWAAHLLIKAKTMNWKHYMSIITAVLAVAGSLVVALPVIEKVSDIMEVDLQELSQKVEGNILTVTGLSLKHLYEELTHLERMLHTDRREGKPDDPYLINRILVLKADIARLGG